MSEVPIAIIVESAKEEGVTMKALEWHGASDIRVGERPKPRITDPNDALIHVTTATICGSDLHMYLDKVKGMHKGSVMGHEFMGIIEDVGSNVKEMQKGDRVVCACCISCGSCWYCKHGYFSCCDETNPSKEMEEMYGHRTAGIFGYTQLTGGWDGGQAEYVRVPFADVNCLKVPDDVHDDKAILLSDILCTGWHANEMGQIGEGDTVAVWGCGPVGLMTMMWAKYRGAGKIIAIDNVPYRLQIAREQFGAQVINFDEQQVLEALKGMTSMGPDVVVDAAGYRFPKTLGQRFQTTFGLESDATDILQECIKAVRKCGTVSIVGDYFAYGNAFPTGAMMEKGLTLRAGRVPVQQYWKHLLEILRTGEIDSSFIVTQHLPLEQGRTAYKMFANKEHEALKILLHTQFYHTQH